MGEEQMTDNGQGRQPNGLSTSTTVTDRIRIVTLAGEIDYNTGGQLRQALDVTGVTRPRIVIDMHQVTFMDSVGINILITETSPRPMVNAWPVAAESTPAQV
jgi:stage II sporulation protein AA (anti-sigma F factor antagonist)